MTKALRVFGQLALAGGLLLAAITLFSGPPHWLAFGLAIGYAAAAVFWWVLCGVLADTHDQVQDNQSRISRVESLTRTVSRRIPEA